MTTLFTVGFLIAYGVVHLAVWLPQPEPAVDGIRGFEPGIEDDLEPDPLDDLDPDRSDLLTIPTVTPLLVHRLSVMLAVTTGAAYVVAGLTVAIDSSWMGAVAVTAGLLGLVLKTEFFERRLVVGVLVDVLVISCALFQWPVPLT